MKLVFGPSTGDASTVPGLYAVYAKPYNLVHFGRKMVRNAVHNALLNALTMATLFPRVPAAFQQWERCSYEFPLEMTLSE